MLRLVAYAPDGVLRFPVRRADLLIGSEPACDIHLPYTGVARNHARLSYDGGKLHIEDLGTRRGILVSGRRVKTAELAVLDEIKLGAVTLLVEDVVPSGQPMPPVAVAPERPAAPVMTAERLLDHLSSVSNWVLTDVESRVTFETLGTEILRDFGGGVVILLEGVPEALDQAGIKLVVATDPAWLGAGEELVDQIRPRLDNGGWPAAGLSFEGRLAGQGAWMCGHRFDALERHHMILAAMPRFAPRDWSPVAGLKILGDLMLLGMVHHVGTYEPILPGQGGQQPLSLVPELVVGPSESMARVLEQLKAVVGTDAHVLLRGERGSGRMLLAKSLHLSSPRRRGPFVTASGSGASATHIEADLFGAEVPGRDGTLVREGKISLAHGGVLYLDDADQLPLPVQERLVRFLRSGEVEPAGSRVARKVDVRILAGSRTALEQAVTRDAFRVDLAYRLSQFVLDVPSLKERREDLPLLIQALINRFCHETGKRMRGITVKAMNALLTYEYPGNLAELQNIVRQLVYTCPPAQPIDVSHLPEAVRLARVREGARVDASSDLDLEQLVASTEAAAIREALRRCQGNKSQAAKALGLSRNGLAMKMQRFGLQA
jgi:transcriptional regulator with AAA-type ATPase domain